METSKVYYTDLRTSPTSNLLDKMERLVKRAGIEQLPLKDSFVAIKIHIVPAGTVRHAAGIAKIHNIFARQQAAQLAHSGQPAKAAVKYADGTSIHQ